MNGSALAWQVLAGSASGWPTIRGEVVAVAALDRLQVWRGGVPLAGITSPARRPGRPCISERHVCWGPGRLALDTGRYTPIDGPAGSWLASTSPLAGWVPQVFAWHPAGDIWLAHAVWQGPADDAESKAPSTLLLNAAGALLAPLLVDALGAFSCAALGPDFAVLGGVHAPVFDLDGRLRCRLANATPALRIEAAGTRLLLVEHGRLSLHAAADGRPLAGWSGRWIDAALGADERCVWAVDTDGRLARLDLESPGAAPSYFATEEPLQAIAVDDRHLLAVQARGAPLVQADLPPPQTH